MARDPSKGYLKILYSGVFLGPPLVYVNNETERVKVHVDKLDVRMILNFLINDLKCTAVTLENIYFKGLHAGMNQLSPLEGDSAIRAIIGMVEAEEGVEVYVDSLGELPGLLAMQDGEEEAAVDVSDEESDADDLAYEFAEDEEESDSDDESVFDGEENQAELDDEMKKQM